MKPRIDAVYYANGRIMLFCEELDLRYWVYNGTWTNPGDRVATALRIFRKRCATEIKRSETKCR